MNIKEINRCELLEKSDEKQIAQREGAKHVRVTERHFRKTLHGYRQQGAGGFISGHRRKISGHQMSKEKLEKILRMLKENYHRLGRHWPEKCSLNVMGSRSVKEPLANHVCSRIVSAQDPQEG